jgi:NADP-reducing hydrogenase subunit HndB
MPKIMSLDELNQLKDELFEKQSQEASRGISYVAVGMASCGIASGSRETMQALLTHIETNNLQEIVVTKTGCIGFCDHEPIVQVRRGNEPNIVYGGVTPEVACRILDEHVRSGNIIGEYVLAV